MRPGSAKRAPPRTRVVEVDALDHAAVSEAAHGVDVVLHALNPTYQLWRTQALPLAYSALTAAEKAGATLMFPGNLYNYGSVLPEVIDETTPMRPTSHKGRIRVAIEDRLQEAAEERGLRVIIVRAGDFFGSGRGSWLDLVIAKDITRLRLTYPGPLEVAHEWAYLPNLARHAGALADQRAPVQRLRDVRLSRATPSRAASSPGHRQGRAEPAAGQTDGMVADQGAGAVRAALRASSPKSPICGTSRTGSTATSCARRSATCRTRRLTPRSPAPSRVSRSTLDAGRPVAGLVPAIHVFNVL